MDIHRLQFTKNSLQKRVALRESQSFSAGREHALEAISFEVGPGKCFASPSAQIGGAVPRWCGSKLG